MSIPTVIYPAFENNLPAGIDSRLTRGYKTSMTKNTYTGLNRRYQLPLRALIDTKIAHGWEIVTRQPLEMRRGRAVITVNHYGVLTTSLETVG